MLRASRMSAADDLQARTDAFADLAIKFVEGLPAAQRIQRLANQFQDCSTSVGANYRAARRAKSHADAGDPTPNDQIRDADAPILK